MSSPVPRLAYGVRTAYLLIAAVSVLATFRLVPVYAHMMTVTLCIIYIGSVNSVKSHVGEGVVSEKMETKDAMMFPVIGSCVLFSLYCVFKFFPKEYVNMVIKAYFFVFGIAVLTTKVDAILERTLPVDLVQKLVKSKYIITNPLTRIPYIGGATPVPENATQQQKDAAANNDLITITPLLVLSFIVSIAVGTWHVLTGNWLASNIFGMAFSIQGIELLSLGSYVNGAILLVGLFFYDIFWVFGTEVMVTVAKSFDAPIKLLFPQTALEASPSMLGLGDIVIPGIFIALLLRYDALKFEAKPRAAVASTSKKPHAHAHGDESGDIPFKVTPKMTPFFFYNLVAYFFGLTTTVGVMYYFKAAQPALLYLVPACLGGSILVGAVRGELKQLFKYSENDEVATEAAHTE